MTEIAVAVAVVAALAAVVLFLGRARARPSFRARFDPPGSQDEGHESRVEPWRKSVR